MYPNFILRTVYLFFTLVISFVPHRKKSDAQPIGGRKTLIVKAWKAVKPMEVKCGGFFDIQRHTLLVSVHLMLSNLGNFFLINNCDNWEDGNAKLLCRI